MSVSKIHRGVQRAVIFDLDGTLIDSARGVMESLARAFEESGRMLIGDCSHWVGPPLADALERAGIVGGEAESIRASYRADYDGRGVLTSTLFPGARDLLLGLKARGDIVAVATSKPRDPTAALLDHLGVAGLFDLVVAESGLTSRGKAALIGEVIQRLHEAGTDVSSTVLVGDRHYDIIGAAANGLPSIFVTWGYAATASEGDGAAAVAETMEELRDLLIG